MSIYTLLGVKDYDFKVRERSCGTTKNRVPGMEESYLCGSFCEEIFLDRVNCTFQIRYVKLVFLVFIYVEIYVNQVVSFP